MLSLLILVAIGSILPSSSLKLSMVQPKSVLLIGGTRFSGLYLWRELHERGHHVTLFNRGKTALKPLPNESEESFNKRVSETKFVKGNRQAKEDLEKLATEKFDVIYDMNGREASDTAPLADLFNGKVEHFVYMSSAGVYKKSPLMPHVEVRFMLSRHVSRQ
jgi:nucleoside-diphosphate-sugar epimerase